MKLSFILHKLAFLLLLLGGLSVILYSCQKENLLIDRQSEKLRGFSLTKTRRDYEKLLAGGKIKGTGKNEKTFNKTIYWEESYVQKLDTSWRMIVPFSLKDEIYVKYKTGVIFSYSSISFLVISKKNDKYTYEFVTKIPDDEYLNYEEGKIFSGTILVENIFGDFVKGYTITPDGKTYLATIGNESPSNPSGREKNQTQVCVSKEWYSCASVPTVSPDTYCSYMYTETVCTDVSDGNSLATPYGNVGSSDVPTETGGPNGDFGTNLDGGLCPPTKWTVVGNSYNATVKNLGMFAIKPGSPRAVMQVVVGEGCVTIPSYEGLTPYQGAEIFAQAFNLSRIELIQALNNGTVAPNALALRNRFIERLKTNLKNAKRGATFSSQGCSGSVQSNDASYGC